MSAALATATCYCGHPQGEHTILAPQCSHAGCICLRYRAKGSEAPRPLSSAIGQAMCRCAHAARMHERDDAEAYGRGKCFQGSCGCTEYRPAEPTRVDVPPRDDDGPENRPGGPGQQGKNETERPGLVEGEPAAASPPSPLRERHSVSSPTTDSERPFPCPVCGKTFTTPQGVGGHRAKAHPGEKAASQTPANNSAPEAGAPAALPPPPASPPPDGPREVTAAFADKLAAVPQSGRDTEGRGDPHRGTHTELPEAAKQGSGEDRSSAPATDGQVAEAVPAAPGTATAKEDPAAEVGDAPHPAAGPADNGRRHSISAHVDLGVAGHVDLQIKDAPAYLCVAFIEIVLPFLQQAGGEPG